MDLNEKAFEEYLAENDEVINQAYNEAKKAVKKGDYDYDDIDWEDDS